MAGPNDMDGKNQIVDLPEPTRRLLSPEERLKRQWELLVVVTHFVSFYACIHKFFIPFILKFTNLNHTPYSEIQPSLLLPITFSVALTKAKGNTPFISFLCGVAILFGVYEIYLTAVGTVSGWFALSRLLSSIPLAITAGFLMSQSAFTPRFSFAWVGAGLLLIVALAFELSHEPIQKLEVQKPISRESRQIPAAENPECGAQELHLTKTLSLPSTAKISIEACGLKPSLFLLTQSQFTIENTTAEPINLHLIIEKNGRKVTGWNLLVRSGDAATTPPTHVPSDSVGLLYSDSKPAVGIVGIQPNSAANDWVLTRKPIEIRKAQ